MGIFKRETRDIISNIVSLCHRIRSSYQILLMDNGARINACAAIEPLCRTPQSRIPAKRKRLRVFNPLALSIYRVRALFTNGLAHPNIMKDKFEMTQKVLVVDDESVIRDILVDWLQEAGFETETAANGDEGLQRLHEYQPDMVISDVWMPGMDGYHFCRMVRRTSNAAIIMMTGVPQEAKVLRKMNLDIDDYVIKPIEMVDFMRLIEAVFQRRQLDSTTSASDTSIPPRRFAQGEERLSEIYGKLSHENREMLQEMAERMLDSGESQ